MLGETLLQQLCPHCLRAPAEHAVRADDGGGTVFVTCSSHPRCEISTAANHPQFAEARRIAWALWWGLPRGEQ